ncbi:MAG: Uma2 family endonuclease, partial [Candidatus Promineifilaceae bacterium]
SFDFIIKLCAIDVGRSCSIVIIHLTLFSVKLLLRQMMITDTNRRLFTVEEYYRMAETGILTADDRVELIKGEIVTMSPVGPKHASIVNRLTSLLNRQLAERAILSIQNPIHLSQYSEPEPDLAILQERADFYEDAHPEPEDVLLVIEISDSSLAYDSAVKANLYAQAGIIELWIIDLNAQHITTYRKPTAEGYMTIERKDSGDILNISALSDIQLKVRAILV